jgi:L-lysine 2,3-aminomutase
MGGVGSGRLPGTKAVCGTTAKYQYHRKRKENCELCKTAMREFQQRRTGSRPRVVRQPPSIRKEERREWLIDQKVARIACMDCHKKVERNNTFVFDYDHRDPEQKSFAISEHLHSYTTDKLLHEMDKCDLICANCHRVRTNAQQKSGVLTGYKQNRYKQNRPEQLTLLDLTG